MGERGPVSPFQSRLIYRSGLGHVFVPTGDDTVLLGEVRDSEGRSMNGQLAVGDQFITPTEWIKHGLF